MVFLLVIYGGDLLVMFGVFDVCYVWWFAVIHGGFKWWFFSRNGNLTKKTGDI